jgi:hypothetical protein
MEQRLRCSVLGVVVLGAICALASGCGSKKEETSDNTTATTLTPESAAAPALTVPPPTPVVVPPPPPATPPPPPKVEKSDPLADGKAVAACCASIRRDAAKATGADKQKLSALKTTCGDLSIRVRKGESTKEKAMSAIKAAGVGTRLPVECT